MRSAASSNTGASRSSSSRNFCARGCSLIPPAPRSRQRTASSIGLSVRSSRTNGTSRPSLCSANASVRSFGARKPGCRSGSSRQNMNEREIPCACWIRSSSSRSPRMPSMSSAEMDVRVEELGVRRQLRAHELVEALDESLARARARPPRAFESTDWFSTQPGLVASVRMSAVVTAPDALAIAALAAEERGEAVVDSGLAYGDGEPVRDPRAEAAPPLPAHRPRPRDREGGQGAGLARGGRAGGASR